MSLHQSSVSAEPVSQWLASLASLALSSLLSEGWDVNPANGVDLVALEVAPCDAVELCFCRSSLSSSSVPLLSKSFIPSTAAADADDKDETAHSPQKDSQNQPQKQRETLSIKFVKFNKDVMVVGESHGLVSSFLFPLSSRSDPLSSIKTCFLDRIIAPLNLSPSDPEESGRASFSSAPSPSPSSSISQSSQLSPLLEARTIGSLYSSHLPQPISPYSVGEDDLDPLRIPHSGRTFPPFGERGGEFGGMEVGPNHPIFSPSPALRDDRNPLSQVRVPPGARFDPFGPVFGDPLGRYPHRGFPDFDHFPPPGGPNFF